MTLKLGKLYYIQWADSCSMSGWHPSNFGALDVSQTYSIGWLIEIDEESVTVAGSASPVTDEFNGVITIPRSAILKVCTLKKFVNELDNPVSL